MEEQILVVDDSDSVLRVLDIILRDAGFTPHLLQPQRSEDFPNHIEDVKSEFDLIIMDVNLPGSSGYELFDYLQANEETSETPVIFMSASHAADQKVKGLESGGADYITKPFDPAELVARMKNQLKTSRFTKSLAKKNTELKKREDQIRISLDKAAILQQSFLPNTDNIANIDCAWKYLPYDGISGDIFNVMKYDQDTIGMYMLDVSGHGLPEALISTAVAQLLQPTCGSLVATNRGPNIKDNILSPKEVFSFLNKEFPVERFARFFSMVFIILDLRNGQLTYSNAGHPPPVLLRADGKTEFLTEGGTIIGVEMDHNEGVKVLGKGDKIVVYCDGVTEQLCSNHQTFFGAERLIELLQTNARGGLEQMLDNSLQALYEHSDATSLDDDISLLAIEYKGAVN